MNKPYIYQQFGNINGIFVWDYNFQFFIETSIGNFLWNSKDYLGGDGLMIVYFNSFFTWLKNKNLNYAREKGTFKISKYTKNEYIFDKKTILWLHRCFLNGKPL